MSLIFKKVIFSMLFNFTLFTLLVVGIQNSKEKNKINLIVGETVNLPISFIIGSSFICGSIFGSFLGRNN